MKQTRSRNYPLWIGSILIGFLLIIAAIGPRLAPHDPTEVLSNVFRVGGRAYIPGIQPIPPFTIDEMPLGADFVGRDLYSRLLWAVRPTLILCFTIAALRILFGVTLGLAAGWFGGATTRAIDALIDVSLAVPILLFALAVITFFGEHDNYNLPTFILALVTTGWASTAVFVKNSTLVVKREPFIDGARAAGATSGRILRSHVLPQLWPALPALVSFELAATLLVVAELGFLGLFIGETFVIMGLNPSMDAAPIGITANYPELAQMMSNFWSKMIRTPWEVALVGFAIFLTIFAFNMLGEGLRRHMDVTRPRRAWRRRSQFDTSDLTGGRLQAP